MVKGEMLYEGKAKKVFATNNPEYVIIDYKDDATAFNGEKKGTIDDKGILNNSISSLLFELLRKNGVKSHYVAKISDREVLCKKVSIIPLEVIVRNVAAGSFSKRLGIAEGTALNTTVFEICYKDDALGDPLINDYHAVAIGAATFKELKTIYKTTAKVNKIVGDFFLERGIRLIDFKIEFGRDSKGNILLADEISPDTCRFWDAKTGEKLDKDRFRRDLGNVKEAYVEILNRVSK
ncbi:MAG: phosphoribosylaminoimidazolesuccinocarboxamide synthase [Spirochaetes bacterium]|uniref:Phosphoribosylaminoimidazole-succinocarboxamide synthase n=1 Tax=Candidatus Gallitreponema excrementavium TaxID=2840840 RepID=A0A9D9N1J7_9SPIR|nr:phosphoribosylaminoimidazolesuccinocarboxamide synthase [Candidatus Gallitreponema excrementavium]